MNNPNPQCTRREQRNCVTPGQCCSAGIVVVDAVIPEPQPLALATREGVIGIEIPPEECSGSPAFPHGNGD